MLITILGALLYLTLFIGYNHPHKINGYENGTHL
jgi:hypothetical protein